MVGLLGITLLVTGLSPATAGSGQPPSETPSFAPRDGEGPEFVPGELLVRYEPGTPSAGRASARQRHGLTRVRGLPLVPGLELVQARGPGSIPQQAARVSRDPAVRYAEPNFIVRALGAPLPNDPELGELWGLHNTGQTGGTPDADIDAPEGWQLADASHASEIVVGVIDTGIDINHPDLVDRIWTNPNPGQSSSGCVDDLHGCDFTKEPPTGATVFDPLDGDDHGTHVAGTIAATMNNDMDVAGVSQAKIMPIKFLGPDGGTTANAIRAIDYAIDNGADITNNSWGGGEFSQALKDAIERANDADQLFIAAAGNDGKNLDQGSNASYPASYDNANIVAVAATTHTDALASFSNYGKTSVDLGAPGASILSTVPRFGKAILTGPDTGGPAYRSAFHTFGLEGVPSAPQRQAVLGAALGWMGVGAADPILVVDDDGGQSFQTVYQQTLTALGHTNITTFTVPTSGSCTNRSGPTAGQMASHDAVIWFTGSTFSCTLNNNDRTRLTGYLGGGAGRNLLLFGQDIGFDLTRTSSGRTFLRDRLRGDYVADYDFNFRPSGVPDTPYEGLATVTLNGGMPPPEGTVIQGQFWSSAFEPRSGAVAGLRGAPTTWFNGTSMAAPHVTGAAAQVMARFPSLRHPAVKARLMDRGDATSALAGKTVSGRRLNLAAALEGAPAPPTGLTATAGPGGVIDLAWTASTGPDVAGYRVYRGTTSGSDPTLISGGSLVTGTSYQDADTADGTTYFYVVRGVSSSDEEGGDSNQASATADATPPTVASTDPDNGATLVPIDARVGATFSEPMDPESIAGSTFVLRQGSTQVAASVAYDAATMTATLTPDAPLEHLMTYTAEVTTGVTDLAGNPLAAPFGWSFETADDTEAPSVHIDGPQQNALVSRSDSLTITGSAEDNIEVTDVEVAIRDESGAHWDGDTNTFASGERWRSAALTPESGTHVAWEIAWSPLPSADAETFTILVRARDAAGNRSEPEPVAIVLDNVAPKNVTTSAGPRYQRQRAFPVSWSAEDGGGIESFDVERRAARFNGGWGSWQPWEETSASITASSESTDSARFRGNPGTTQCFRTTATDAAGNSKRGSPGCTAIPLNNTQLGHVRSWRKRSGVGGAYLGTFSRSTQQGARLVRKGVQAKRLAIVATRCPKCGTVAIRWRGKLLRRINLKAPTMRRRQVIGIKSFPGVRKGRLVVVVRSRGKPVIVEGLGVSRV